MTRDPRNASETAIQSGIVDLMQFKGLPSLIWIHIPNEGKRSVAERMKLKKMGFVAGAFDFVLVLPDKRAAFMEVKRQRVGRMSEDQIAFAALCDELGVPHAAVRSVDEAEEVLWCWGALRGPAPMRRVA